MRAVRRRLVAAVACALLLTGCGADPAPADAVPALSDRLEQVDAAVAADDPERIRTAVDRLVATAEQARDSGQLDDGQVDAIAAAAEALLAELPEPEPATPSTPETSAPAPPEDDEAEEGLSEEEKKKQAEEQRKKLEEERKKLEEERKKLEKERGKGRDEDDEDD